MNGLVLFYFHLRNELWKLFGKKRTYIGFGICLTVEACVILKARFSHGTGQDMMHRLELMGYKPEDFVTNITVAAAVLVWVAQILLLLYVALVGGDLLAKEAEDGTLRMILSRPISRLRLVATKWVAGAIFSVLLAMVLAGFCLLFARLFFPPGNLFAFVPMAQIFAVFDRAEGWQRYELATLALSAKAITIMGLACMFSCFNMKPAAATILGISVVLTFRLLLESPYFQDWKEWMLTYHLDFWLKTFAPSLPKGEMLQSLSILFGFNLTFFVVGASVFQMRDIKS